MSRTIIQHKQDFTVLCVHGTVKVDEPFGEELCCHPCFCVADVFHWWRLHALEASWIFRTADCENWQFLCSAHICCHEECQSFFRFVAHKAFFGFEGKRGSSFQNNPLSSTINTSFGWHEAILGLRISSTHASVTLSSTAFLSPDIVLHMISCLRLKRCSQPSCISSLHVLVFLLFLRPFPSRYCQ